jgi:hypothetical protein
MLSGLIRWALAIAFIVSDKVPHTARYTWLTTLRAGAFMLPVWRVLQRRHVPDGGPPSCPLTRPHEFNERPTSCYNSCLAFVPPSMLWA